MDDARELNQCRECLCLASRSATRGITAVYDRHLRPHGVRATQFTILTMLILRGPTPLSVLATALGMDRTTLTRNLARLEANGWTERRPAAEDARTFIVDVTRKGRAVARVAFPAWRDAQRSVMDALGASGVAALRRLAGSTIR